MEFNSAVNTYLNAYEKADAAQQAEWKEDIDPKISVANKAFDVWGKKLKAGDMTAVDKRNALNAKNEVIDLVVEITGGVE